MSAAVAPTIGAARSAIASGEISPVELAEETLAAAERRNGELGAYLRIDRDGALAAARDAEGALRTGSAGPLAGIPLCVKDVIDVAGMPTTAGAAGWVRRPEADAVAVARLRAASAVIVGKGNTNEFAFGIDGQNPHWGDCHNPIDPARMSGGSSSGPAAATAAGLALGGIGTDTSGSLRVPASLCGLVAVRPTTGRVPTDGVVPLAWSYDTVGPLARTVADAALLLDVLSGRAPVELERRELAGARIGLLSELTDSGCAPEVADGVHAAAALMESAGAEVHRLRLPRLAEATAIHQVIQFSEGAAAHASWIDDQRPRYDPAVLARLDAGAAMAATDYLLAQRARQLMRAEAAAAMSGFDALIAPSTPVIAPPLGAESVAIDGSEAPLRPALLSFTLPLTQLGGPVVAVPAGEVDGLPFGLQIVGRAGDERGTLALAAAYRRAAEEAEPEP